MARNVGVIDVDSKRVKFIVNNTSPVLDVNFCPKSEQLVFGCEDGKIKILDLNTKEYYKIFEGHTGWVTKVIFSHNGSTLISGGQDGTIRIWHVVSELSSVLEGHRDIITSISLEPSGTKLISGSNNGIIILWDINNAERIRTFPGHTRGIIDVNFSSHGNKLISSSKDGVVRIWELTYNKDPIALFRGHTHDIESTSISSDSKYLATGSRDMEVKLWDLACGRLLKTFEGHKGWVISVVFTPNSMQLASGDLERVIHLWDVISGHLVKTFKEHTSWVSVIAFNPKGNLLASRGRNGESIALLQVDSGDLIKNFEGHRGGVDNLIFTSDGTQLISSGDDKNIRLWCVSSGKLLRSIETPYSVVTMVLNSERRELVVGCGCEIRFFDVVSGVLLKNFDNPCAFPLKDLSLINGGRQILLAVKDAIQIYDIGSETHLTLIEGINQTVNRIAVLNNGNETLLMTTSGGKSAYCWRIIDRKDRGVYLLLIWTTQPRDLVANEALLKNVQGLSHVNLNLLSQKGATEQENTFQQEGHSSPIARNSLLTFQFPRVTNRGSNAPNPFNEIALTPKVLGGGVLSI